MTGRWTALGAAGVAAVAALTASMARPSTAIADQDVRPALVQTHVAAVPAVSRAVPTPSAARPTPVKTAAPTPTPTANRAPATPTPLKKGVASAMYLGKDPAKIAALNVSWAYNWSSNVPASTSSVEDVPMVWGPGSVTPTVIKALKAGEASGAYRRLLAFNEPDHTDQSNMTPQQAIALWPQLESTGLQLGSPATASPNDGWLDQFMSLAAAHGYRVDFIALHFYIDFTSPTAVANLQRTLQSVYARYHKPIWITEIGAVDTRPWGEAMKRTPTDTQAVTFMSQVTSMLDGLSFVTHYAWFADNVWADPQLRMSSLYDADGVLTASGQQYSRTK
jgi:hypothetical protein